MEPMQSATEASVGDSRWFRQAQPPAYPYSRLMDLVPWQPWIKWLRPRWSNLRFRESLRAYQPQSEPIDNVTELRATLSSLYANFQYKLDDASMLFDAMDTPPQCLAALESGLLRDDCDGYHAAIYHLIERRFASANNVRLITIVTKPFWHSHTMCVFDFDGQRYLINYRNVVPISKNDDAADQLKSKKKVRSIRKVLSNVWSAESGWQNALS